MKVLLTLLIVLFGALTSLFLWIYLQREKLPYNAEGKFFNAEEGVVYHEQARTVYGIFVLIGTTLIVSLIIWRVRVGR